MRDKNRIRAFCSRLAEIWERFPDLWFGQLMVNVFRSMGRDPFFPEDEEMLKAIEKWAKKNGMYAGGGRRND